MKPFPFPPVARPVAFLLLIVSAFFFSGCAPQRTDLQRVVDRPGTPPPPVESKATPDMTADFSAAGDPGAQPTLPSAEAGDRPSQAQTSRETQAPPPKAPAFAYPSTAKTRPLTTRGREPARSSGAPVAQASPDAAPAQTVSNHLQF